MPEDLIGQRFRYLTVIEPVESSTAKSQMWRCRCDCGKEAMATTIQLERGLASHCGCKKIIDITGQTFGKLLVLGLSDKRGKRGKRTTILWECQCECGEIVHKPTDTLKSGSVCMCDTCAGQYNANNARKYAGFVEGTQLPKIRDMTLSPQNKSGVRGVDFHTKSNMWRASIKFRNQTINLGYYHNFADAVKARQRGEEKYFGAFLEAYDKENNVLNIREDIPDEERKPGGQ